MGKKDGAFGSGGLIFSLFKFLVRPVFSLFSWKLCRRVTLFMSAIAGAAAIKAVQIGFCRMEYA